MNKIILLLILLLSLFNYQLYAEGELQRKYDLYTLDLLNQQNTVWGMVVKGENIFTESSATFLTSKNIEAWADLYQTLNFEDENIIKRIKRSQTELNKNEYLNFFLTVRSEGRPVFSKIKHIFLINDKDQMVESANIIPRISKGIVDEKFIIIFPRRVPNQYRSGHPTYVLDPSVKTLKMFVEIENSIYMYRFDPTKVN